MIGMICSLVFSRYMKERQVLQQCVYAAFLPLPVLHDRNDMLSRLLQIHEGTPREPTPGLAGQQNPRLYHEQHSAKIRYVSGELGLDDWDLPLVALVLGPLQIKRGDNVDS